MTYGARVLVFAAVIGLSRLTANQIPVDEAIFIWTALAIIVSVYLIAEEVLK